MMMGDTGWSLIAQLSKTDAVTYLEDRKNRGFNTVLVNLIEHQFATNAPSNFYNERPFLTTGDFSTPNEAYFAHAAYVIGEAASRGILVLLAPAYIGAMLGSEGWYSEMVASGATKLREYGRYVATRFSSYPNILWVHCGDENPTNTSLVSAIANGIREVNSIAVQTAHCHYQVPARAFWPNEAWLNVNTVYERDLIYSACAAEYQRTPSMPVFHIEALYENENYGSGLPTEQLLRRQAYFALLSGAFGHVFGNNPIWHFDGPGLFGAPYTWKVAMAARGSECMTFAKNVLQQVGWANLAPDFTAQFLTAGQSSGESRAVAAITSSGSAGIVYMPTQRSISINLARLSGPRVNLRWYDPSAGTYAAIDSAPVANTGVRSLAPPATNSANFGDWFLVAESTV
ncbi:MAG: DUF4038 domain-containing protein [Hyphomonadaceae bacterium]|nr:DUF4038 domain-containing protein [Hyphomonadaceae bacterium]